LTNQDAGRISICAKVHAWRPHYHPDDTAPADWKVPPLIAEIVRQTEQDILIWEHKASHKAPLLCAGDGPIMALRHWARQFYPPL
jgi:hypothetical protein